MGELEPCREVRFPAYERTFGTAAPLLAGPHGIELREALNLLYEAFSTARLSEDFDGCPHCFTESDLRYLRQTARAELTSGDLSLIASKLVSTLGTAMDVPYFLPRLIEGLAQDALIDVEPLVDRIAQIPPSLWTPERRIRLSDAFEKLFQAAESTSTYNDLAESNTQRYVRAKLSCGG